MFGCFGVWLFAYRLVFFFFTGSFVFVNINYQNDVFFGVNWKGEGGMLHVFSVSLEHVCKKYPVSYIVKKHMFKKRGCVSVVLVLFCIMATFRISYIRYSSSATLNIVNALLSSKIYGVLQYTVCFLFDVAFRL